MFYSEAHDGAVRHLVDLQMEALEANRKATEARRKIASSNVDLINGVGPGPSPEDYRNAYLLSEEEKRCWNDFKVMADANPDTHSLPLGPF